MKGKKVSKSIKVNKDLWKDVRMEAVRYDYTASQAVEEALIDYLTRKGVRLDV